MKVLLVAAEAHPLVKTGGLADVCGSLPGALRAVGLDARLLLPGYPQALSRVRSARLRARIAVPGYAPRISLLEAELPGAPVPVYLADAPGLFRRPGSPYHDDRGQPWPDNALRFAVFAHLAAALATGQVGLRWRPDVVHAHDWHTGLVPALLSLHPDRPGTVFTVHNLQHQGVFPGALRQALAIPESLFTYEGLEYYGDVSFMKGGLTFADWLTTVSPTYAREILEPAFGCGLAPVLRHRHDRLLGILNGADYQIWDPRRDARLAIPYAPGDWAAKAANRAQLRRTFRLRPDGDVPVIAFIGRLVPQKGVDLLLEALEPLLTRQVQLVALGTGDPALGEALEAAERRWPGRVGVYVGYSDERAHRIFAGADLFLMPSRFEPCGLTQIYALRYGAIPIVHATGGLRDTVRPFSPGTETPHDATGFRLPSLSPAGIVEAVDHALGIYARKQRWSALRLAAMACDFSWRSSARRYRDLYLGLTHLRRAAGTGPSQSASARPAGAAAEEPPARLALPGPVDEPIAGARF